MPASARRIPAALLVFGAALATLLVLAITSAWLCDDAFIALRYSRNFAHGLGLRYNPGVDPPVEGYTQLGWVLWMSIFEWLGWNPRFWAGFTGVATSCALLASVAWCARRSLRLGPLGFAAALFFFATAPTVVVWSTGGLGTMPFALAVFVACERLLGDPDRPRVAAASIAAACAVILRADGPYWLAIVCGVALLCALATRRGPLLRAALVCGAVVVLVVAANTVFRLAYYGDFLPNTVRAKVSLGPETALRGLKYVVHYWLTIPSAAVVLAAAAVCSLGRGEAWLRACTAVMAGTMLYCVLVSGDFMSMGRFVLPALPFMALAAGRLVQRVQEWRGTGWGAALTAALLLGSVPVLFDVHLTPQSWRKAVQFRYGDYLDEHAHWQQMISHCTRWTDEGRAIKKHAEPGSSLVRAAIGAVGYYSDLRIFDSLGLVNAEVARFVEPDPKNLKSPGHDRVADRNFFAKYDPTYSDARIYYAGEEGIESKLDAIRASGVEVYPITVEEGFSRDGYLLMRRFRE
jgi:hypothetical protein